MRYQLGTPMETCECKCECDGRRSMIVRGWVACWQCGSKWLEDSRTHVPKKKIKLLKWGEVN